MDKMTAKVIHAEMAAALEVIAKKHGLKKVKSSAKYGVDNFGLSLEFIKEGAETLEAKMFKMYAPLYGLEPEALGAVINYGGTSYRITGIANRTQKFMIIAERVKDGKTFKLEDRAVARAYAASKKAA